MFNELKEIWINAWQKIKYIWVCEWHKAKAKSLSYNSREDWEEELEHQAQQDAYLHRISEADHAYDSYEGDNHPAHEKQ